ncbi:hypothetical protein [Roseovarius sp. D0-M9]|uniref:hypothetical protein n=1 Tax=Roseovarius sp. D0-M9 TaxID=3127117 RepID=UPI0030102B56
MEATGRGSGAIAVVTLIMAVASIVSTALPSQIALASLPLGVAIQLLFSVLLGMVQVSVLTTIYGHFYEDRPLG